MAEQSPQNSGHSESAETAATRSESRPVLAMVKAGMFVAIVVAAECLLAYFYLPTPDETAAWAEAAQTAAAEEPLEEPDPYEETVDESIDQVEVDLEEFSVSAYQPVSNTSLRIDFHLFGIVAAEDEGEFLSRFEENRHRFREQVLVIARSAELTDLTDAGLGLIKRRILEKSNEALGKPLLRAVVFSDFSFIEQ